MSHPFSGLGRDREEYEHDTYERDGVVVCKDCGKTATSESRLNRTPCEETGP